jgi:hypothetical protein
MPERIFVPTPEPPEELRQLAEAVADLHYVMGIIVENAKEFVPGEAVDELGAAWVTSEESMRRLVENLIPDSYIGDIDTKIEHATLEQAQLTGAVGKAKRSILERLKDAFFMYWNSEPRTNEKRAGAVAAASELLEAGSTIVSSIQGYEYVVEILSITKQLMGIRAKRDH